MKALVLFLLFLPALITAATPPTKAATPAAGVAGIETGEIKGAKYFIRKPAAWNRHLLLLAPGLRPESSPLEAEIPAGLLAYQTLVEEGWMVATTSYRRNGIAISDDIQDLDDLLAAITDKYSAPDRVLLEGESMGGLIGTLIAERPRERYSGVVAIDAALQMADPNDRFTLSMHPRIPILFLTNQTDLGPPRAYATAKVAPGDPATRPVIFLVQRNGHVNLNQQERLVALRALDRWVRDGVQSLPPPPANGDYFNATVTPPPHPSRVLVIKAGVSFQSKVTAIAPIYGNLTLDAQPADFAAIGLSPGFWFKVVAHGTTFRTFYGRDFGSVKKGEWVAYPDADGTFLLSRNLLNAAKSAEVKVGDPVLIESFGIPPDG